MPSTLLKQCVHKKLNTPAWRNCWPSRLKFAQQAGSNCQRYNIPCKSDSVKSHFGCSNSLMMKTCDDLCPEVSLVKRNTDILSLLELFFGRLAWLHSHPPAQRSFQHLR